VGNGGGEPEARYRAFISYSHRDSAFGRRLHRRLERYWLPRRLVGCPTPRGPVPRRLVPIFRDREDLSAAHDLTTEVRAALADSGSLIVVCSPNAAASPWVAREVELFRELHPDRPVLAALIAGDPVDAFPEPLRRSEPLAADFRKGGDGARPALLKLIAGVVGVGLDELVQRDAQRRLRGVMAVTAGAVAATLVMALLTIFALRAQAEAERQRAEAESLVEFMLTDLRDRLRGVGRLDAMDVVNSRALSYYDAAPKLTAPSLERRARVLHAVGENQADAGDVTDARAHFTEAHRATTALLAEAPDDPDRILAQAQSEYWLGFADYRDGKTAQANARFLEYRRLARELLQKAPENPLYRRELGYAEGNLCSIAIATKRPPKEAVGRCQAALDNMQRAATRPDAPVGIESDLANRHAWLSQAYKAADQPAPELAQREAEEAILRRLMTRDPLSMQLKERWVALQRARASLDYRGGNSAGALDRLRDTATQLDIMVAFDPTNDRWRKQRGRVDEQVAYIKLHPTQQD
jgi:hypothetical protein